MAEPTPALVGMTMRSMPSFSASRAACSGRGAAEGDQRAVAQGLAALDGVHARGVGHVLVDHLDDAEAAMDRPPGPAARRCRARAPSLRLAIEREAAAGEAARVDAAQHEVGVGHRRRGAAAAVAGGPGFGAGALRPDLEALELVDRGDRAAAGADLDHLDHRDAERQAAALEEAVDAADLEAARRLRPEIVDQADLGGGAAHVERQHASQAAIRPRCPRPRMAPPAGPDSTRRIGKAHRRFERGQPAARQHQEERAGEAGLLELASTAGRR